MRKTTAWAVLLALLSLFTACSAPPSPSPTPSASTPVISGFLYADGQLTAIDDPENAEFWESELETLAGFGLPALLGVWAEDWNGEFVLQLPATLAEFQTLTGHGEGAQGVTLCDSSTGEQSIEAQARIYINPEPLELTHAYAGPLLLHELVHAASCSPQMKGPGWIKEGVAESITTEKYPDQSEPLLAVVKAYKQDNEVTALPGESGYENLALSWFAVQAAIKELGREPAYELLYKLADTSTPSEERLSELFGYYKRAFELMS
ncbi:MAG: hypothetical protein LBR21_07635 [Propionibacteriaceae bacterium]|nr:hypothetical protein [Propionibacteriaceae bacterium]